MLAPEFVAAEIKEWLDAQSSYDDDLKNLLIELSKRIVSSYNFYNRKVNDDG